MYYQFNKITLHNFLSFGDAALELKDRSFCLIEGKNHNPSDRALSNGSGKSTIVSAISWALTGQTIQGISSNIENINSTGGCFVSLDFNVDKDNYVVTRYKNHDIYKTDLKIEINDEDRSGKGIRESSNLLAQYLPDLTLQLLSSVILLGQGLPNSFTKNTPSGRKELLEKLTKSDYMIQDVKDRLAKRLNTLTDKDRVFENALLEANTSLNIYNNEIIKKKQELNSYVVKKDFKSLLESVRKKKEEVSLNVTLKKGEIQISEDELNKQNQLDKNLQSEVLDKKQKIFTSYSNDTLVLKDKSSSIKNEIASLNKQITDLKNIKDVCPTCGQKIPGVIKKDTSKLEEKVEVFKEDLKANDTLIKERESQYNKEILSLTTSFSENTKSLKESIVEIESNLNTLRTLSKNLQEDLNKLVLEEKSLLNEEELFDSNKTKLENDIKELENKIDKIEEKKLYNSNERDKLKDHIETLTKINTLVKRDFRGYLLLNIINYIQEKSREYCKYIFDTDNLSITLEGNDIDIQFSNKQFESLSGGEKQKLDVIIQFAIRDMMSNYLDFHSNILFLDEITDNLDSKGCDGLINLISNTLNDLESIFIISHHQDELEFPVDSIITVEKDSNGISRIL